MSKPATQKVTAAVEEDARIERTANRNPRGGGAIPRANPSTTCDQRVKRWCRVEEIMASATGESHT